MPTKLMHKVGLITLVVVVALLVNAGSAFYNIIAVRHATDRLADHIPSKIALNHHVILTLVRANAEAQAFARSQDPKDRAEVDEALAEAAALVAEIDALTAEDTGDTAIITSQRTLQVQRRAVLESTQRQATQVVSAVTAGNVAAIATALEDLESGEADITALEAATDANNESEVKRASSTVSAFVRAGLISAPVSIGIVLLLVIGAALLLRRNVVRPVTTLATAARAVADGQLTTSVTVGETGEIGMLQHAFNHMTMQLRERTTRLAAQIERAEAAQATAEAARVAVAEQLATITSQQQVIREMNVPMLPLNATTLLMPLIGTIDPDRLEVIQTAVLRAVEARRTRHLLVDVTGVPVIDAVVAHGLVHIVQAVRLLGAQVRLVGVRPEVAQAIVSAGISLTMVTTDASLQEGIAATLEPLRMSPGWPWHSRV